MADSGPGVSGPMSGGGSDGQDAMKGMVQLNDLVYAINPDLSVAVNRTHKVQYPQTQDYTSKQTCIFIVNSGADFIDTSRSWLTLDLEVPDFEFVNPYTAAGAQRNSTQELAYEKILQNHFFGPNGSILNLIDSVVVSSRSGDELSRVNDYGHIMNIVVPLIFGEDWKRSIGSNLGMGSYVGAKNTSVGGMPNEQRVQRFSIPLYLLSPFFNYGRLMPSAVMSGLRVEIRWKPLNEACQQFFTGAPRYIPPVGIYNAVPLNNDAQTEFTTFLAPNDLIGANPRFPDIGVDKIAGAWPITPATLWTLTYPAEGSQFPGAGGFSYLTATTGGAAVTLAALVYTADMLGVGHPLVGKPIFATGSTVLLPFDPFPAGDDGKDAIFGGVSRFTVVDRAGTNTLVVFSHGTAPFTNQQCTGTFGPAGVPVGAMIASQIAPEIYQAVPGGKIFSGIFTLPNVPVSDYFIRRPQMHLCSVQLTDAIQRVLNEYSSVNGLEIVYADYDRTTQPFVTTGSSNPIYMEIRKSASRALAVYARVVESSPNPHLYDGFASCKYSYWNDYQFQLGSLYFPQQRVEDNHTDPETRRDNVASLAFNYTLDAADRYHPKSAPTILSLRGDINNLLQKNYHPVGANGEHGTSTYLLPASDYGKYGSFVNGGCTIGTTLERSSAFDLSGIPTNNSRTLAIRGNVGFNLPDDATIRANFRATLYGWLKYVRCARAFLLNIEVEQ